MDRSVKYSKQGNRLTHPRALSHTLISAYGVYMSVNRAECGRRPCS